VFTDSSQDGAQTRQAVVAFFADGVVVARALAAARKARAAINGPSVNRMNWRTI